MKYLFKNNFYIVHFVIISIILVNSTSFLYFPFNYGWWQSYSYFDNSGLVLYKDINLVFPPLFIKLISAFTLNQFDSVVFSLVRISIFSFALISILKKYFSTIEASLICSVILLVQAYSPVYISDDYHIFEKMIFIIYGYSLFNSLNNINSITLHLNLGLMAVVMLFTKQNIGVLLYFSILLLYSIEFIKTKRFIYIRNLIITIAASIICLCIFNYYLNFNLNDFYNISFNNDSKGNLYKIASNFLFVKNNAMQILISIALAISYFSFNNNAVREYKNKYSSVTFAGIIFFSFLLIYLFIKLPIIINVAAITSLFIGFVYYLQSKFVKYSRLSIFGLFYMYANSMTSDFSYENSIIIFAPITPILINSVFSYLKLKSKFKKIFIVCFILLVTIVTLIEKVNKPYSWWGYRIPSLFYSKYEPPYEKLKGIKVDIHTYELLSLIKKNVDLYSKTNNDVYFYPHLPYFYYLHNKLPSTKNPVQWFDVISNKNTLDELNFLNINLPEIVVMFDAPYFVYKGHALMKGEISQQKIPELFDSLVRQNKYELIEYKIWKNCSYLDVGLDNNDIIFFKDYKIKKYYDERDNNKRINEIEQGVLNNNYVISKREEVCNRLKIYKKVNNQ